MSDTTEKAPVETPPLDGAESQEAEASDSPPLDEHTQKVVDAIRADFKKERAQRQAAEAKLKAAEPKVSEYDRLAAASKTELERAQESIDQEKTRASTALQRLASAEIRAALAGVVDDPAAIVEDLNLSKFVDDDGEVDQAAIEALKGKYATFSAPRKPRPDASQGSAGAGSASDPAQAFAAFMKS